MRNHCTLCKDKYFHFLDNKDHSFTSDPKKKFLHQPSTITTSFEAGRSTLCTEKYFHFLDNKDQFHLWPEEEFFTPTSYNNNKNCSNIFWCGDISIGWFCSNQLHSKLQREKIQHFSMWQFKRQNHVLSISTLSDKSNKKVFRSKREPWVSFM